MSLEDSVRNGERGSLVERLGTATRNVRSLEWANVSFWSVTAVLLFLYVPMVLVALMSVNTNPGGRFPITGFTLEWYRQMLFDVAFWRSFFQSLQLMVLTAGLSIVLALPAVYGLRQLVSDGYRKSSYTLTLLMTVPLYVPLILIGVALLLFFSEIGIGLGPVARQLGHLIYVFPFAFLILYAGMRTVPDGTEEAARDLGANRIEAFVLAVVPQMYSSIVSAFIFGMLLSLNEFIITFMVSGSAEQTVPLLIFARVRTDLSPRLNAIGVLLLAIGILAAVVAARFDPRMFQ